MERTVPRSASDEVDLYLRTIYSLLRSTAPVQLRTLEQVHISMASSLHPNAGSTNPDVPAFLYALMRLPQCIYQCKTIVLGQSTEVFVNAGYPQIEKWEQVAARARRRLCFYDGEDTLACYIASRSDIDDLIPTLVALQIEWNKIGMLMSRVPADLLTGVSQKRPGAFEKLADLLLMNVEDLDRLRIFWGETFPFILNTTQIYHPKFSVRLLAGSLSQYWRATSTWWRNIRKAVPQIEEQPIYLISSNTHSVINLLSGYALLHGDGILESVKEFAPALLAEWDHIENRQGSFGKENFLYYSQKEYLRKPDVADEMEEHERKLGITRIPSLHTFDVNAQVFNLSKLNPAQIDPRLSDDSMRVMKKSDALILNIDYPLGLAAYNLLSKIAEHARQILGVYIMGKAATLNGRMGDVMIPNVVHDEHSLNTYLFNNVFTATDVTPYLVYGSVLDNQKAVSVLGTFLQNSQYMDVFYRESFSDIEMESGPYLSAVYEMSRPKRHPQNEVVNLYSAPFDVGILHYASDTPLSKGRNLGAGTLSYFGMDSTYACSIAILRRIMHMECQRLKAGC